MYTYVFVGNCGVFFAHCFSYLSGPGKPHQYVSIFLVAGGVYVTLFRGSYRPSNWNKNVETR